MAGNLEVGLEALIDDGKVVEMRPHTGLPEPYILSSSFVNAHSHLEYRGMQGRFAAEDYWSWIRAITLAKREQTQEEVERDCFIAARENRRSGVGFIAEHSDRLGAAAAIHDAGLDAVMFYEVITRFDPEGGSRIAAAEAHRLEDFPFHFPSFLIPHAFQTVDEATLASFGASELPFSMHVAESELENQLTLKGTGAIADTFKAFNVPFIPSGNRLVPTLKDLGLVRKGAQFVHCCAVDESDLDLLATASISVAHCPGSNSALRCPAAPIREMLERGIQLGLGLDSAASSGPIDMFAEMREALRVSMERARPLNAEEVWRMATDGGRESLKGIADVPQHWIKIRAPFGSTLQQIIETAKPDDVSWIES